MGLHRAHNGAYLLDKGALRLEPGFTPENVVQTTRIGISRAQEKPWRFYVTANPHISRP
jgi:3-methyladenine DNA glycosylase Mpg